MLSPRATSAEIKQHYPDDYGAYVTPKQEVKTGPISKIKEMIRNSVLYSLGYGEASVSSIQRLLASALRKRFFLEATYSYGERFPHFVPGGKALEVGCGNALFLSFLKRHGWDVTGVDMSETAAAAAKNSFGIDVIVGQIEESGLDENSFDYIHLSHVVEHFYDPLKTMAFIARLLKPNGTLYMEVPNAKGIGAEMNGEYWYGWDAPRHVVMFSPDTCRQLLEKCGLLLAKMETGMSDTSAWQIIYKQEALAGIRRTDRPALNEEEEKFAKERFEAEKRLFMNRPLDGDYVACWATKEQ
jgi:SAM-dependent methyltransferase